MQAMHQMNEEQRDLIQRYMSWFHNSIINEIGGVLRNEVKHFLAPTELAEVEDQVTRLQEVFSRRFIFDGLPADLVPMFKRMIIIVRRTNVAEIESLKEKTHNPDLLQTLDDKLKPLNELLAQPWLRDIKPARIPLLTNYISLQRVEEIKKGVLNLEKRVYDQKFHILQSPTLIIDDLRYYREKCEIRGTAVVVAFLDVDDFKKSFNEKYGEVVVDRRVLPVLMAKLEAHVHDHGYAYRHGGDEFVLVLPNMTFEVAIVFLDTLRREVESLRYPGIEGKATVSIGFIYVNSDCYLTEREVVEKANEAKKFAKGEGETAEQGKNRIATFVGTDFDANELQILNPTYPFQNVRP
jgi:diguanylate cyclase (GGDEF)-like protein